jgi:dephospho-CoA kinase
MVKAKTEIQIVIGVVGLKAAGKDELCRYISGRGFDVRRLSDPIRAECAERGIKQPTVKDLQDVSDEVKKASGDFGHWAGEAIRMAQAAGSSLIAINGIRNPGEIDTLERVAGSKLVLVGVTAPTWVRAERLMARARPGDPQNLEEFILMDDRDRGLNQPPEGQQVDRCLARVPHGNIYSNERELQDFHVWIEQFMRHHIRVRA